MLGRLVRAGTDIHKPLETNLPGVYAIGDVAGFGQRVAAAVGEGTGHSGIVRLSRGTGDSACAPRQHPETMMSDECIHTDDIRTTPARSVARSACE
jgi:pyruvate/2-oxoglutarate dehydrogenase complex dihydrolipoamide dehydrogenase (E3) component